MSEGWKYRTGKYVLRSATGVGSPGGIELEHRILGLEATGFGYELGKVVRP